MKEFIAMIIALVMAIFMFAYTFIGYMVYLELGTDKYKTEQYVYSLGDTTKISGSFMLGFGRVRENWQYVYYYEENNEYKLGSVDSEQYSIVEDDSMKPQLRSVRKCLKEDFKIFIFNYKKGSCSFAKKNQIVVPKGTIRQEYSLDLEK